MAQFILFEAENDEHLLPEADQSQASDSNISGSDLDEFEEDNFLTADTDHVDDFSYLDPYELPKGLPDSITHYLQSDSYLAALVNLADTMPSKKKPTKFQQKVEEQEREQTAPGYQMNPSTSEHLDAVIEHQLKKKQAEQQKKRIALDAISEGKAKKKKVVPIKVREEDDEADEDEEIQSDEGLAGKKKYRYYTSYWLLRLKIAFFFTALKRKVTVINEDDNDNDEDDDNDDDDDDNDYDSDNDALDIETRLANLEKEQKKSELTCGLCLGPTSILTRKDGTTWLKCLASCKFPWLTLEEAGKLHTKARHGVEDRFRTSIGGAVPRCPNHRETGTLVLIEETSAKETSEMVGHLFFICTKPLKDGGPCIIPKRGHWSVVADVIGDSAKAKKTRRKLENCYALDKALQAKRQREAVATAVSTFASCEKDFLYGTGVFAPQKEEDEK